MDAFEPTAPLPNGASVEGKKELPAIKSEPEDANKGMIIEKLKINEKYFNIIWQEGLSTLSNLSELQYFFILKIN